MGSAREETRFLVPVEAVADFCRRHRIRELALFGSILRDDFTEHSDIDVLVDFQPGSRVTFFDLSDLKSELEGLFHRDVDLVTKRSLHPMIAPGVLASREVLYVAAQMIGSTLTYGGACAAGSAHEPFGRMSTFSRKTFFISQRSFANWRLSERRR